MFDPLLFFFRTFSYLKLNIITVLDFLVNVPLMEMLNLIATVHYFLKPVCQYLCQATGTPWHLSGLSYRSIFISMMLLFSMFRKLVSLTLIRACIFPVHVSIIEIDMNMNVAVKMYIDPDSSCVHYQ